MSFIRSVIIWIKIYWKTSLKMKDIVRMYGRICALDYDEPVRIYAGGAVGSLKAFGNTLYFMDDLGSGFAVNEGEKGEIIAQTLKRKEDGTVSGEFVFRGKKYIKSLDWIRRLQSLDEYLNHANIYSMRQKELYESVANA